MTNSSAWKFFVLGGALATGAFLLTNCSSDTSSGGATTTATFTSIYSASIGTSSCTQCHSSGVTTAQGNAGLDFSTQSAAYNALTGTVNGDTGKTQGCTGVHLVVANSPTTSYLVGEVASSAATFSVSGCTVYDHSQQKTISSDEQTAIVKWIQAGALNN